MNRFIITTLFSFIGLICFSQTVEVDNLKKEIQNSKNEKEKVDLLLKLSQSYYLNGKIDSVLLSVHKALFIAQKNNYQKGIYDAYKDLGNTYQTIGETQKALAFYEKALNIFQANHNKKEEALILERIGIVYESQDNYKKALLMHLKSLKINESINYKHGIASSYDNIGIIYSNENNYSKSLEYHFKSLRLRREIDDSVSMGATFHNIAYVYECQNKIEKAIKMYLLAIRIKQKKKLTHQLAISYNNIGSCYNFINIRDSAFFYHKKSYNLNKSLKNNNGIELSSLALADDFFKENKLDSSKFYAEISLQYANKGGNLYFKKNCYILLSQIYKRKKEFELALKYHELSQGLNDSIYNQDSQRIITEMITKYESEKKESENKILKNKDKIKSLEINNQRIFIGILILIISVTILISWLIISRKNSKEKEQRIKTIFEAQEKERKRIAMELHDGIGQTLAGAKVNLATCIRYDELLSEELKNQLKLAVKMVDEAYLEVRELAHFMMPKALRDIGLVDALTDLLHKTLTNTTLQYEIENNDFARIEEHIEVEIYRIFQELLTNILKHANATKITVVIYVTELQIMLMVEDDGIGVNSEISSGIGLSNIQTRVNMLNGTFVLNKGETKGTAAVIRIPHSYKESIEIN